MTSPEARTREYYVILLTRSIRRLPEGKRTSATRLKPNWSRKNLLLRLHLHQVGQRILTSELLSMPSTQRSLWRGGRCRVS
jgi:hypothetical protein